MHPPAGPRTNLTLERLAGRDILDPAVAALVTLAFVLTGRNEGGILGTVIGVTLPIAIIRRWPLLVLVLVSVATVSTRAVGGWLDVTVFVAAALSAGSGLRRTEPSLALVVIDATLMGVALIAGDAAAWAILAPLALAVPGWLVGDAVRGRGLAAVARLDAAAARVREREAALRAAAEEARRHMARELHDIVAHSVSVMVIQAGAARQVVSTDPDRATESLLAIEATGREAMTELRRIVGVLADAGDAPDLAPQPGVEQLGALVERVVEAGLPIDFRIDGQPRPLPPTVDVTAYRIVQEALTNALKYAGRARTLVAVEFRATELKLEIADDGLAGGSAPGDPVSGRGLIGMRERATQCGGHLEAGPRLGGGFAVRAWLPTGAMS